MTRAIHVSRAVGACVAGLALSLVSAVHAAAQTPPPRELPARTIPVPETVSPQMQKIIGAPINPNWNVFPKTAADWKKQVDAAAAEAAKRLPALREQLRVKLEPMTVGGVKAYALTPHDMPAENRNRLLIHVLGGCYVSNPGESGTSEATMMAGFGRFKVISVDYRMPPEAYFPAALDDAIAVWKAAQSMAPARNTAIFGSSAGGGLTLSAVLRVHRKLRQAGVEAVLEVFEGQAHGGWYRDANVPESKEAFEEIARFFDKHLGK